VALGGLLLLRKRWAVLGGYVAGAVPVALGLLAYQWASTGSAVRSGYQSKEWEGESGFFTTHLTHPPSPVQLVEILVGSRGLLVFTPVVLLAIVGLVQRWRSQRDDGALVGLTVLAGFLLLQASWANTYGGDGPGPRYVTPALPFLAIGLAHIWPETTALVRRVALGLSLLTMGLATVTGHLLPEGGLLGVAHLRALVDHGPTPTLFTMALGSWGWLLHVGAVIGVVALARTSARPRPRGPQPAVADQESDERVRS
jgi:hypothetical protein